MRAALMPFVVDRFDEHALHDRGTHHRHQEHHPEDQVVPCAASLDDECPEGPEDDERQRGRPCEEGAIQSPRLFEDIANRQRLGGSNLGHEPRIDGAANRAYPPSGYATSAAQSP